MKGFRLILMSVLALALGACATSFSVTPKNYSVSGTNPDMSDVAMVDAASRAYVDAYNAETYRTAVEAGMLYPYLGGGYGNDFHYYYNGVMPSPAVQPATVNPADGSGGGDLDKRVDKLEKDVEDVRGRANDSLRMHKKHKKWHQRHGD
ncbi:hypothetical protein AMJ57_05300 [Parcubacteria bacterium SG8_24]|nr:MAG: hypothetical protein AMJ57_05300 [Parcubacteria bacterium SG8_24]